jgi:hypothetical protein
VRRFAGFFNDPTAIDPQTGQPLYPPPAPPQPPPDPKLLAAQARAQVDQASAFHKAQLDQQQAQNDTIHQQVKIQAEFELAKLSAGLDARIALLETHLKTLGEAQKMQHVKDQHQIDVAEAALGMAASAANHQAKMRQNSNNGEQSDVR